MSRLVQGNQACALGAIAAGCRFYAGYPITPSSEVAEAMVRLMPEHDGVFVQMEDEIASLGAVIGASLAGVKAMTATSGPGFSLMQEHIGYAAMAEIPCVIVDVMRAGPSTGLPTSPAQGDVMQARWGSHGDRPAIALAPASVREVFDLTVEAFNLSERYRTPVVVIYDEVVGHLREGVDLPASVLAVERAKPDSGLDEYLPKAASEGSVAPLAAFGDGYRFHVTGLTHDDRGFPTTDAGLAGSLIARIQQKVDGNFEDMTESFMLDDAEVAVFAYGIVARAAREAIRQARSEGLRVGLIRPIALWPFPARTIRSVAESVETIIVAEMNLGQMAGEVERAAAGRAEVSGLYQADGAPLSPDSLLDAIRAAHRQEVAS